MLKENRRDLIAYATPFAIFVAFFPLEDLVTRLAGGNPAWWAATPKYWLYPLQTLVCAILILIFWKHYTFRPLKPWLFGVGAGLVALILWVSPQEVFHFAPRLDGFNPEALGNTGPAYLATLALRMARLILVVPILEEVFWRGFLMRYLVREDFVSVPFGTYRLGAFFGTAVFFMLVHGFADWPVAFLTGLIYNAVAVRTKSLFACVIAHAVTNAGLGAYILCTRQWGFW